MNEAKNQPTMLLKGDLTLDTVAAKYRELTGMLVSGSQRTEVDLADIGRIDSAGLALLLEWQALSLAEGGALLLKNVPDDLVKLAALCEAGEPLGLVPTTDGGGAR